MAAEIHATKEVVEQVSFLSTLGIDWKLFIAQLVNFSVVLFVLWKWAYKPLVKIMDERSEKIEKSLQQAQRIEQDAAHAEAERERILLEAKKESRRLLEEAGKTAEKNQAATLAATKAQAEKIMEETKQSIVAEREQMVRSAKAEIVDVVIGVTEKVLREKIDHKKNEELVEAIIQKDQSV